MHSDKLAAQLAATGKYRKATLEAYDTFQHGMLIRTGILLGVVVLHMITLANLPNVAGPSLLIPLGAGATSLDAACRWPVPDEAAIPSVLSIATLSATTADHRFAERDITPASRVKMESLRLSRVFRSHPNAEAKCRRPALVW